MKIALTLTLSHRNGRGDFWARCYPCPLQPKLIRLRHTASDASVLRRTLADAGEGRVRALSSGLFQRCWKRSSIDRAPGAAHGCYRGSTDAKGIIRIVHFDAYREARRETDPVKRALDARQAVDACAVLRQHGPTEPNHSAAEMPAGLRLQINIHRRAGRDVPQLRLAEVGDDVPGANVH